MTKLMTENINIKMDLETKRKMIEMAKNSDNSKIVRLAIQHLYENWPIVSVPMRKLSEFNQITAQETQQEGLE